MYFPQFCVNPDPDSAQLRHPISSFDKFGGRMLQIKEQYQGRLTQRFKGQDKKAPKIRIAA